MKKRTYTREKYEKLKTLIPLYLDRKITRKEMMKECNLIKKEIRDYFRNHKIPLWDSERIRTDNNEFEKDAKLFIENKISIEEIAKKHNISIGTVKNKLNKIGIDTGKKKPIKNTNSKYFSIKQLCKESEYARIFYEFNK